jgi:hypothetical protein
MGEAQEIPSRLERYVQHLAMPLVVAIMVPLSTFWCPKAIALIGRLPTTLEDRSITILMRRRTPEQRVDVLQYVGLFAELEPRRRQADKSHFCRNKNVCRMQRRHGQFRFPR